MRNTQFDIPALFNIKKPVPALLHFIVIAIFLSIIHNQNLDKEYNLKHQDQLTQRAYKKNTFDRSLSENIVILEIDDPSFNFLSNSHGSMRISIAKLLLNLNKMNPKCIVVNFLFYGKGQSKEEIFLTAAVEGNSPIFFLAQIGSDGELFTPLEAFSASHPRFGFFELLTSSDKTVREAKLYENTKNLGKQYDLSSQLTAFLWGNKKGQVSTSEKNKSLIFKNTEGKEKRLHLNKEGTYPIRFSMSQADIPRVSALELIERRISSDIFENKVIIIDGTASVYQNRHNTPLGVLPLSTVMVNTIQTQWSATHRFNLINPKIEQTIILIISLIAWLFSIRYAFHISFPFVAISLLFFFPAFEVFFEKGVYLPYGTLLMSWTSPVLYSWIMYSMYLYLRSREFIRLASLDALTELHTLRYFYFRFQRLIVRQKRNNKNVTLLGCRFFLKHVHNPESSDKLPPTFLKAAGQYYLLLEKKYRVFSSFSPNENLFITAISPQDKQNTKDLIWEIKDHLIKLTEEQQLEANLLIHSMDLSRVPTNSASEILRLLQSQLKNKPKEKVTFQEYQRPLVKSSLPDSPEPPLPETDLEFLALQISEDKKDITLMQEHLFKSAQEIIINQKLSAMGQLSSYYAHELKNPLHNLLGCLEILEDKDEPEEEKMDVLTLVRKEVERMIRLTNKMRSHFKPSQEEPEESQLNPIISEAIDFLANNFQNSKVSVSFSPDKKIPSLFIVPDQFRQLFLNLFLNAIEAMPNGGTMEVDSIYDPPVVKVKVTDTGKGIQAIDIEQIFDAFYTTKKETGTGMGLFACYKIIQHHGGTIKVESEPGQGTSFEVILPV